LLLRYYILLKNHYEAEAIEKMKEEAEAETRVLSKAPPLAR
jgi:hypothetical protein